MSDPHAASHPASTESGNSSDAKDVHGENPDDRNARKQREQQGRPSEGFAPADGGQGDADRS